MASGAQHTISSLPYTVTTAQNGDTLVLSGNLSSPGTGITFTNGVHDVYLRGRGDTIIFNTSGNDNEKGIYFPSGVQYNIKIDSLTIIQYSDQGSNCMGFGVKTIHDVKIYDCNVHVKGFDSRNFYHYSEVRSYNVEIRGGNWTSFVNSFSNRCQNSAAAMDLGYGDPDNGDYSYWVHNVVIDSCPHTGILASGVGWVDSCVLWGNAHNDYYDYPSQNVCWSADNPYMIGISGPGSRATYNVIRARDSYEGARGIYIGHTDATADNPLIVAYNDIRVTNGKSDYPGSEGDGATRGIRVRASENGAVRNVYIHDNYIEVWADTLSSTTHIGNIAFCFQATDWHPEGDSCFWYNNTFVAMGDTTGGFADGAGKVACAAPELKDDIGPTWISRNNRYITNGTCIAFGNINGGTINWTSIGDTLEWLAPRFEYVGGLDGDSGMVLVGTGGDCLDNVLRDIVYIGADEGVVTNHYPGGDKEVFHQRTLRIYAYGNNSLPVPDASIRAVNNYGDTVLIGTSNSQGFVEGVVNYDYDRWIAATHYDSVYNDFTLKAKKDNDSTVVSHTVTAVSSPPVLILSNTSGEEPPEDITPPGRIDDLNAVPGEAHGECDLSWTAPGDDENIGTAAYYVIKYSTVPITEVNWASASDVSNPPVPLEAGTFQTFTVDGLDEGEIYYFGIKAYDEVGNSAPLSNVPNSFACGIMVPMPLETVIDSANASAETIALAVDSYLPLYYEFALDTIENFPNPRIEVGLLADSTVSAIFGELSEDIGYFWRSRAMASDHSDSSDWSQFVAFNILTGVSQTLASSYCLFPQEGDAIQTNRPIFVVEYVPDIAEIYFQVDDNASFSSPVSSGPVQTSQNNNTEWQITEPLSNGMFYYWRISSDNIVWTSPIVFSTVLDIHPYPNPFRTSEGHTNITFTNLPPESRLIVATVSGSIVRRVDGIGPENWIWDVRNDNGGELASGVYLYVVEYRNGSSRDKLMVIR
jgi:hypothetical protein